jgi:hypothetical protein
MQSTLSCDGFMRHNLGVRSMMQASSNPVIKQYYSIYVCVSLSLSARKDCRQLARTWKDAGPHPFPLFPRLEFSNLLFEN